MPFPSHRTAERGKRSTQTTIQARKENQNGQAHILQSPHLESKGQNMKGKNTQASSLSLGMEASRLLARSTVPIIRSKPTSCSPIILSRLRTRPSPSKVSPHPLRLVQSKLTTPLPGFPPSSRPRRRNHRQSRPKSRYQSPSRHGFRHEYRYVLHSLTQTSLDKEEMLVG